MQILFETPECTANTDGLGALRLLETVPMVALQRKTGFYQASTSELFGKAMEFPQRETTPFYPRSSYAAAHWITVNHAVREFVEQAFASQTPFPRQTIVVPI